MSNVRRHISPMKPIPILLAALLVATNGAWMYRAFDKAVTDSYQRHERYESANRLIAASTLASESVRGKSKTEVEGLLRKLFPSEQPFEKEGVLQTLWLSLPLNPDGSVRGVYIAIGTEKEAALGRAAVVGNEVFYGSPSSSSSQR